MYIAKENGDAAETVSPLEYEVGDKDLPSINGNAMPPNALEAGSFTAIYSVRYIACN